MAGFVSDRVLEEIRFRNDIVEVIQGYLPLKRSGATYKACCPFHKEKTPSFNVNPNMQIFKCFGCGEGGDVISFIMKHQGLDFMAAVRFLADRVGVEIQMDGSAGAEASHRRKLLAIHEGLASFYRRCLTSHSGGADALAYVKSRGLDDAAGASFGIGYAPAGWSTTIRWGEKHSYSEEELVEAGVVLHHREKDSFYDRFRDRLMFPIRDVQGRVIGFSGRQLNSDSKQPKYVNSPETAIFHKGRVLFGLDLARQAILGSVGREAIIVEGQVDVIRCHQYGFACAVAAQGTAFTDEHVALLKRYADSAVLVYDSDGAGQAAALKTAHALMQSGMVVRVAVLPAGDDPDSFLLREGEEAFALLLEGGVSSVAFQIEAMREGSRGGTGDMASTMRIAKAALGTIACTPDAVQRSYLLREAAELLGVAESALEADLQKVPASRSRKLQEHSSASAVAPTEQDADGVAEGRASRKPRGTGIPAAERMFFQLLEYGNDDTWEYVSGYVLSELFHHPACRALFLAHQKAREQGVAIEEVEVPESGQASFGLAMKLLARVRKMTSTFDSSDQRRLALEDAMLRLWYEHLQRELKTLQGKPGYPDDAEIFARCSQIKHDLDSLRHWDSGQDVIETELAMMGALPGPPAADSEV